MSERKLRCPSCDASMQTVERRGVVIDICQDCRGVFLDRGELDNLLELASRDTDTGRTTAGPVSAPSDRNTMTGAETSPLAAEAETFRHDHDERPQQRSWRDHRDWDDDDRRRYGEHDSRRGRRRGWFDIFDLD